jgi:hypothetical protein
MTGERQLARCQENVNLDAAVMFDRFVTRNNKACLGQIRLARKRLHFIA